MYRIGLAFSAMLMAVLTAAGQIATTQAVNASGRAGTVTVSGIVPPGPAVTGAPYYAEQEQEHVQTLADGTHISQKQPVVKLWRDSQGRTRTERPLPMGPQMGPNAAPPLTVIEINDPVEGVRYVLDAPNKIAHRMKAAAVSPGLPPPPPPTGAVAVQTRNAVGEPAPAFRQGDPNGPQFANEDLGTQAIEGVMAQGRRSTTTYPIGAFGNDRPVVTTTETWMSQELRMTVLSQTSDPRSGENTTRLTHISRAEPELSLFQPPPDYKIEEESGNSVSIRYPAEH